MSREAVEAIIGKAVVDSEFRAALFADPDTALAGYDLTQEEVAALKAIDAESMEALAGTLDERISKALGVIGLGAVRIKPTVTSTDPAFTPEPSPKTGPPSTGVEPVPVRPSPDYDSPPITDMGTTGETPVMPPLPPIDDPAPPATTDPVPPATTDPVPPGHAYPIEPPSPPPTET